jgi:hypothetical protein
MALTKIIGAGAEGLTLSSTSLTIANGLTLTDGDLTFANGHGIDFSATSDGGTGTPGEKLVDYEKGTYNPVDGSDASLTFTVNDNSYVRIGSLVTISIEIVYPTTTSGLNALITLPFTCAERGGSNPFSNRNGATQIYTAAGDNKIYLYGETGSALTNADMSGKYIITNLSFHTS